MDNIINLPPDLDARYVRAVHLARLIRDHGHTADALPDGSIRAVCVVGYADGSAGYETTILEPRRATVYAWLGY